MFFGSHRQLSGCVASVAKGRKAPARKIPILIPIMNRSANGYVYFQRIVLEITQPNCLYFNSFPSLVSRYILISPSDCINLIKLDVLDFENRLYFSWKFVV